MSRVWGGLERRAPLARVGKKRRALRAEHERVRESVFARDGGCMLRWGWDVAGPCLGRLTPHHIRKSSQGGSYSADNLVALCTFHNEWVETHREEARLLGLHRDRRG